MEFDKQTQNKIYELQLLEQNLQGLIMQKQAFQIELSETENALNEIFNSKEDVFKLVGNIMIKSDKKKISDELKRKKDIIILRLKSINSEENNINNQIEEIKKEVMTKIK
ncbi:MAG: prefoldin subunit [Nanoarchaeota archaeon]